MNVRLFVCLYTAEFNYPLLLFVVYVVHTTGSFALSFLQSTVFIHSVRQKHIPGTLVSFSMNSN